jgi:hypothetical protein
MGNGRVENWPAYHDQGSPPYPRSAFSVQRSRGGDRTVVFINIIVYIEKCEEQRVQALARGAGRNFQAREGLAHQGLSEWKTIGFADARQGIEERTR